MLHNCKTHCPRGRSSAALIAVPAVAGISSAAALATTVVTAAIIIVSAAAAAGLACLAWVLARDGMWLRLTPARASAAVVPVEPVEQRTVWTARQVTPETPEAVVAPRKAIEAPRPVLGDVATGQVFADTPSQVRDSHLLQR